MNNTTMLSFLSPSQINLTSIDKPPGQHKIVPRLPITYTDEEKNLIYNQDRDSPLPIFFQSYWMDILETKFVILHKINEFSLYLLPHILKKECFRALDFTSIKFKNENPILIAFSADEQFFFVSQNNNIAVARVVSLNNFFLIPK